MTQKDHKKIAEVISNHSPSETIRATLAMEFANMLKADNGRFDSNKFFKACGVNK